MPRLSPFALIVLPFLAAMASGCFQGKNLPHAKVINAAIAVLFFLLAAALCWLIGGSVSKDPATDMLYYSATLGLIFNTPACKSLNDALIEAVPSPLLLFKRKAKKEVEK